eukprot:362798-Chlamydomonas_euryale.AAC.2
MTRQNVQRQITPDFRGPPRPCCVYICWMHLPIVTVTGAVTLAFPDAVTSVFCPDAVTSAVTSVSYFCQLLLSSSSAKSQSLQRASLSRPGPGPTALTSNRSHTRKGRPTFATPVTASARQCPTPNRWGFLNCNGARFLIASGQARLSKARSTAAAGISGQGVNLVWPGNLRTSPKVVPLPEPYGTPGLQNCASPKNLKRFRDPVLTAVVPRGHRLILIC